MVFVQHIFPHKLNRPADLFQDTRIPLTNINPSIAKALAIQRHPHRSHGSTVPSICAPPASTTSPLLLTIVVRLRLRHPIRGPAQTLDESAYGAHYDFRPIGRSVVSRASKPRQRKADLLAAAQLHLATGCSINATPVVTRNRDSTPGGGIALETVGEAQSAVDVGFGEHVGDLAGVANIGLIVDGGSAGSSDRNY